MKWLLALVSVVALLSVGTGTSRVHALDWAPGVSKEARGGPSNPIPMVEVATWLAMRPVTVRCLTDAQNNKDALILSGAAAYVAGDFDTDGRWRPEDFATFAYPVCLWFTDLKKGKAYLHLADDTAFSVLALTHEAGHLRDWKRASLVSEDEASTQRWAMRHVYYVARRIGVPYEESLEIVRRLTLLHLNLPQSYRIADCRKPELTDNLLTGCGKPVRFAP